MDERSRTPRPKARAANLVVRELPEEVLVYDLERHRAVCLNRTAAFVWKRCDGRMSVGALSRMLAGELRVPVREELVWLALEQLGRDRLLEERIARPAALPRMSRRELMRGLGDVHPIRYHAVAEAIDALLVEGVRPMEQLYDGLRWVHFIDKLYDNAVPFAATGQGGLGALFAAEWLAGSYGKKFSRCLSRMEEMLGERRAEG